MLGCALALAVWWAQTFGGFADDAGTKTGDVMVGDVRVQLLSAKLIRVEPKGPNGFEDRRTFMVVKRDYAGVPFEKIEKDGGVTLRTDHYSVVINKGKSDSGMANFMVFNTDGAKVYDSADGAGNKLHWAPCYSSKSYALMDSPRFFVPENGASPPPDPSPTNGYDFGNDVYGDTYVFMLGDTREDWLAARTEFVSLSGPTPLLPDWSYGTWFTWWHPYDEAEAKDEVSRWDDDKMPLDVWGLDMAWRFTENDQDREYNHPNTTAFADFGAWFQWLHDRKLHTYFNDHPYPASTEDGNLQTSPTEVNFRWTGLTQWMDKGLDFWWFDHNWKFSIPPPQVSSTEKESDWNGLTNVCWGSHVYYTIMKHYNYAHDWRGRPIGLSKFSTPDWKAGMDPYEHAEVAGMQRYPVWWTGDFVTLQASVESMVGSGLFDFKPFVHSDCGGDGWFTAGDLMRWTAHCVFGNILRFHGGPHQPWIYGDWWEKLIRNYLNIRYRLMPTLIAGGQRATQTGFPLVARGDFYWPEVGDSTTNQQYIWMDDMLVAPIFQSDDNFTARDVWIPPGDWQDVWNGEITTGPTMVSSGQPWERTPLWHRCDGGLLVMSPTPAQRVEYLDWSTLMLEAWPCADSCTTVREVYERGSAAKTEIKMTKEGSTLRFKIGATPEGSRGWVVRIHLRADMTTNVVAKVDGVAATLNIIKANDYDDGTPFYGYWPLQGPGTPPASKSPPVAEFNASSSSAERTFEVDLSGSGAPPAAAAASADHATPDTAAPEGSPDQAAPDAPAPEGAAPDAPAPDAAAPDAPAPDAAAPDAPAPDAAAPDAPAPEGTPPGSAPFDCDAGFNNWRLGWSQDKKVWCCQTHQQGCEQDVPEQHPFDCDAGLNNWKLGWSEGKKTWCCQNKNLGCPEAVPPAAPPVIDNVPPPAMLAVPAPAVDPYTPLAMPANVAPAVLAYSQQAAPVAAAPIAVAPAPLTPPPPPPVLPVQPAAYVAAPAAVAPDQMLVEVQHAGKVPEARTTIAKVSASVGSIFVGALVLAAAAAVTTYRCGRAQSTPWDAALYERFHPSPKARQDTATSIHWNFASQPDCGGQPDCGSQPVCGSQASQCMIASVI